MGYDIRIGDNLDERFRITELVQRSGMSTIYKAIDCENGRYVAIKVPHMQMESDAAFFSRFDREEQIGKKLDHPGVLKVISVEHKSRPYIVTEFLEGRTLDKILREKKHLAVDEAVQLAGRVCEILQYMHEHNVVHRDLKPANIMVCDDGSLRIIDFGIAKSLAMRRVTFGSFSPTLGTPHYMAPEQIKGKRGSPRTDVYSLGAILYEMVTGSLPFDGKNPYELMYAKSTRDPRRPRELNPDLTPQLEETILHALERNPEHRYLSTAAMKAELDSPDSVQLTDRHKRRRSHHNWRDYGRRAGIAIFVAAMPVVAFFLLFFMLQHQSANR